MSSSEEEIADEVGPEVVAANLLDDPLDLAEDCRIFQCKTGEQVTLRHYKPNQLSKFLIRWVLNLMQANMSSFYEIQIDEKFKSLHLGTHFMRTLEVLAAKTGMSMIVLTVLKHNPAATRFFGRLGYEHDESNFDDSDKLEYEILSKKVQPL